MRHYEQFEYIISRLIQRSFDFVEPIGKGLTFSRLVLKALVSGFSLLGKSGSSCLLNEMCLIYEDFILWKPHPNLSLYHKCGIWGKVVMALSKTLLIFKNDM